MLPTIVAKVTDIARQIVTRFGMTEALGQAVLERQASTYLGDQKIGLREKGLFRGYRARGRSHDRKLIDEAYGQAKANRRPGEARATAENAAYRGLAKNAHRLFVACALANLYIARRQLMRRQAA